MKCLRISWKHLSYISSQHRVSSNNGSFLIVVTQEHMKAKQCFFVNKLNEITGECGFTTMFLTHN